MNYLIINNVYSYRNRGDSAIVEAMIAYARKIDPDIHIYLASQYWQENTEYYNRWGCESGPPLWDIPMENNKLKRLLVSAKHFPKAYRCRASEPAVIQYYQSGCLVWDAGGGSLFSSNRYWFYLGLYQHLFNLWMGVKIGCAVALAPQSIGPFTRKLDGWVTSWVLRRVDSVMVREPISHDHLERHGVSSVLVPDMAFSGLFVEPPTRSASRYVCARKESGLTNIGVTVLDWRWASAKETAHWDAVVEYIDKIQEAIRNVCSHQSVYVSVFSHADVQGYNSDAAVSELLIEKLAAADIAAEKVGPDYSASELSHMYGAMDLYIGSRMHSCILALLQSVPCIGLAYQPKTTGTFQQLGLEKYCRSAYTFSAAELTELIQDMVQDGSRLRTQIKKAVDSASNTLLSALDQHIKPLIPPSETS